MTSFRSQVLESGEGAARTLIVLGDASSAGHLVLTVSPAADEDVAVARVRHVLGPGWEPLTGPVDVHLPRVDGDFSYSGFRVLRDNIEVIVARARTDETAAPLSRDEVVGQVLEDLP